MSQIRPASSLARQKTRRQRRKGQSRSQTSDCQPSDCIIAECSVPAPCAGRPKEEIEHEIGEAISSSRDALAWSDFDGRAKQCLHAIYNNSVGKAGGGREGVRGALEYLCVKKASMQARNPEERSRKNRTYVLLRAYLDTDYHVSPPQGRGSNANTAHAVGKNLACAPTIPSSPQQEPATLSEDAAVKGMPSGFTLSLDSCLNDSRYVELEVNQLNQSREHFLAIDVECVATGVGYADRAVACVAAVDENEQLVFFEYVRPSVPVRSYLTPLTGLTAAHIENAQSLNEVVASLKKHLLPASTVLVGQSVHADINWLGLREGVDFKRMEDLAELFSDGSVHFSLRHECLHLLRVDIQEGAHSADVDARYAMRLLNCFGRNRLSEEELECVRDRLKLAPPTKSFASQMPFIDGCEVSWRSKGMAKQQLEQPTQPTPSNEAEMKEREPLAWKPRPQHRAVDNEPQILLATIPSSPSVAGLQQKSERDRQPSDCSIAERSVLVSSLGRPKDEIQDAIDEAVRSNSERLSRSDFDGRAKQCLHAIYSYSEDKAGGGREGVRGALEYLLEKRASAEAQDHDECTRKNRTHVILRTYLDLKFDVSPPRRRGKGVNMAIRSPPSTPSSPSTTPSPHKSMETERFSLPGTLNLESLGTQLLDMLTSPNGVKLPSEFSLESPASRCPNDSSSINLQVIPSLDQSKSLSMEQFMFASGLLQPNAGKLQGDLPEGTCGRRMHYCI